MKSKDKRFAFEIYSKEGCETIIPARCRKGEMEIVEITRGEVNMQIGTDYISASAGDIVYIPPNMTFRAQSAGGSASMRGIVFGVSLIEDYLLNYETEILYMFYIQSENNVKVFSSEHPIYPSLHSFINDAYEEHLTKDVCYKLPICANIHLMVTELLRYYCGTKNDLDKMIYHNVLRLRPVINYIAEHYEEKIYVEKLSDIIMVSADYFTKMFRDSIGKTPVDYINARRVNKAMELLIETDLSMSDIAIKVGFNNANYFHKIFKSYMDTSPLAYRKTNKPSAK